MRHGNLGLSYRAQFERLGELGDIEQAIAHIARAPDLAPDNHPSQPIWLSNLGLCRLDRFNRLSTLEDLAKAIECQTRAVDLTPDDHPDLATQLGNLALSHFSRFDALATLEDLRKATEYGTRAVSITPNNHLDLPMQFGNLGLSYRARFERFGHLDDLDEAITHMAHGLALAPDSHTHTATWLSNLGMGYYTRFERLGTPDDLLKSIKNGTRAVDLTPDGHAVLPRLLGNLRLSYLARFLHSADTSDFEQAIELETRGLALAPEGHAHLPTWLTNLGLSYHARYVLLSTTEDLDKAIEYKTRAVDLTTDGRSGLPLRLNNLGAACRSRYLHLGVPEDIERAITHLSRAITSTPDGHPFLSVVYRNIASTYLSQYERTSNPSHLQDSLDHYRKGSEVPTGSPRIRFNCALGWADAAVIHDSSSCMDAYMAIMDLLPQFIWLGASTTQRYHDLATAENLGIKAATAAILYSKPALAFEWLEHARCVVWTQGLTLRSPLDRLHSSHPNLAARLQTIAEKLQDAGSDFLGVQSVSSHSDNPELIGQERRRLANEYENFLRPMKAQGLLRAARNRTAVVISCHERRCDVLIIAPGKDVVQHLHLPEYSQENARKARSELDISLRSRGLRQRGFKLRSSVEKKDGFADVLLDLWKYVVKPVLDFLGLKNDVPIENLPHIVWCPTGTMSLLPLHAAGDYAQPGSSVFHYVVSSYTSTLSALLSSTPSALTSTSRILAISQTNTPGQSPLPGTAKELECLKGRAEHKAKYTQPTGNKATVAAVLDEMEQHDWVHLACHAHQNISDPSKSGFFLHDGTLDLAAINRRSFKNKGLAFLSACQTATGDEKLPDEVIHLASLCHYDILNFRAQM